MARREPSAGAPNPFLPDPAERPTPARARPRTTPPPVGASPARGASRKLPQWFGPYLLVRRVGVGGMAEVFMAKQGGVGGFEKVLAIKRLLPPLARDETLVEMFVHEARLVASLSHPHIVQIFGLGKLSDTYFIAMEYVHGRDLRSILRRASERGLRVPLDIAVFIASRVAAALGYAHRRADDDGRPLRIVHRDVSPQNVLVSYDGSVKLADFGIARAVTRAATTVHGILRGKLAYMSPEQARSRPTPRSDIFSLGVVLYEMLTGRRPIQGDSERTILEALRDPKIVAAREIDPRVPESLDRVVSKALAIDPDRRYQDALSLQRVLEHSLGERRLADVKELARFMDVLFDREERGPSGAAAAPDTVVPEEIEIDLPGAAAAPAAGPEPAPLDDMSLEKLAERFGQTRRGRG